MRVRASAMIVVAAAPTVTAVPAIVPAAMPTVIPPIAPVIVVDAAAVEAVTGIPAVEATARRIISVVHVIAATIHTASKRQACDPDQACQNE